MKRWILAALALAAALTGAGPAAPASAAGELGLSPDGVTWSTALPGPIFDPAFRWVPGDVETGVFYIRNQSSEAGVLDLTMLGGQVTDLIDTGDLTVETRVGAGAFTAVETAGPHLLVEAAPVPAGGVRRIAVRVSFDPASTNESQDMALDLRFQVRLSQDSSVAAPTDPSGDGDGGDDVAGPGGDLPATGSGVHPWMFLVSGLSIALGVLLARRSSRGRKASEIAAGSGRARRRSPLRAGSSVARAALASVLGRGFAFTPCNLCDGSRREQKPSPSQSTLCHHD